MVKNVADWLLTQVGWTQMDTASVRFVFVKIFKTLFQFYSRLPPWPTLSSVKQLRHESICKVLFMNSYWKHNISLLAAYFSETKGHNPNYESRHLCRKTIHYNNSSLQEMCFFCLTSLQSRFCVLVCLLVALHQLSVINHRNLSCTFP